MDAAVIILFVASGVGIKWNSNFLENGFRNSENSCIVEMRTIQPNNNKKTNKQKNKQTKTKKKNLELSLSKTNGKETEMSGSKFLVPFAWE